MQWPMLSFNDSVTALVHLLPRRQLTVEDLAAISFCDNSPMNPTPDGRWRYWNETVELMSR